MGCHTWFYKQSKYDIEDLRTIWLESQLKWIERWQYLVDNPTCLDRDIFTYTEEEYKWWLQIYIRQYRMVYAGNIKMDFINHIVDPTDEGNSYHVSNGVIYVTNSEMPHDLFRKYGYPDDKLYSLQQTLDYINNTKNKCEVYDFTIEKLKEFWDNYPNGMIEFG